MISDAAPMNLCGAGREEVCPSNLGWARSKLHYNLPQRVRVMGGEDKGNKGVTERVKAALEGNLSPGELSDEEQENWAALFMEKVTNPGPRERAVFEERRRKGLGVGLDEDGNLARGSDLDERVKAALDGLIAPSDLTEQEYDDWFDAFALKLATPTVEAEEFFAELRGKSIDPDLIFVSPLGFSGRDVIEYLNLKILPEGAIDRNMLVEIVEDALNRLPEDLRSKFGRSTTEGSIVVSDTSGVWFDDR